MATKKKMLQAAAGNAGGAGLDITDVFSTYLYLADGTDRTINNGVNLTDEGGLTWIKSRNNVSTSDHLLFDTERGDNFKLSSNLTAGSQDQGAGTWSPTTSGFTVLNGHPPNYNTDNYASWTFRKAPKFFDVVTYTGDSVAGRTVSHNLGSVPGMIIVKATSKATNWNVYHRSLTAADHIFLNLSNAKATATNKWNDTEPTDSVFTVGTHGDVNTSGSTYVAYLFAHNDSGDGEFGPDGDQDIIKCGSYTGNGSTNGPEIDLGFEPQWLMVKNATASSNWMIIDQMRGFVSGGDDATLAADSSAAENAVIGAVSAASPLPTGFKLTGAVTASNASGATHIYMAIRRGQLAPPEAGTEVFHALTRSGNNTATEVTGVGFPVDLLIANSRTGGYYPGWTYDRLRGEPYLLTPSTGAEVAGASTSVTLAGYMDGYLLPTSNPNRSVSSGYFDYAWKRAPSFFDVVAYTGTGSPLTLNHNLGVAPELVLYKSRSTAEYWFVQSSELTSVTDSYVFVNYDNAESSAIGTIWRTPDATTFGIDYTGNLTGCNTSGATYIAYLFATLAGVSKVGSYTGNGSSQTINAGFTSGARFILIKRTDSTGDWYVWDTARGIVAGNDPHMSLNTTADEVSDDSIDPDSSGFIVNQIAATNINVSSATYIYYAVA